MWRVTMDIIDKLAGVKTPRIEIDTYFTVTINDLYLMKDVTYTSYVDIRDHLSLSIAAVPKTLLFSSYESACDFKNKILKAHYLLSKNDSVEVTRINKVRYYVGDRISDF